MLKEEHNVLDVDGIPGVYSEESSMDGSAQTIVAQCCDVAVESDSGVKAYQPKAAQGCRRYVGDTKSFPSLSSKKPDRIETNASCVAGMPPRAHTFKEATQLCSNLGLSLCDRNCKGGGCMYNNFPVWSSIVCAACPDHADSSQHVSHYQRMLSVCATAVSNHISIETRSRG